MHQKALGHFKNKPISHFNNLEEVLRFGFFMKCHHPGHQGVFDLAENLVSLVERERLGLLRGEEVEHRSDIEIDEGFPELTVHVHCQISK